jgi:hypothetical protein
MKKNAESLVLNAAHLVTRLKKAETMLSCISVFISPYPIDTGVSGGA